MRTILTIAITALAVGVATPQRSVADEEFSIVINPFTGATSLRNDATSDVNLDSYLVRSAGAPVLDPTGWSSLEDNGVTGWLETSSPVGDVLGELNLFGSLSVAAGAEVGIGNAYTPFSTSTFGEAEPGLRNLDFTYTLAEESESRVGDVEFSARNTVVLVIDPTTGAASLENQSSFNVSIDSYLVSSSQDVLDEVNWSPLADNDSAWTAASGASNRIAEGNLFGSTMLSANGGSVALGTPIDPALLNDETDLELAFTVEDIGTISGGVLFAAADASADFDGDGDVDGNDLTDPVDGWQARYGNDLSGSDFLNWQRQFDGGGSLTSAVAAVPEPASIVLIFSVALLFGLKRHHQ